jgi:ABC-type nitrate/sulfonate/bicarbonate transport system substrate-binding protein
MRAQKHVIRSIVFPGVQNLPNFAADNQGYFASRDLEVETTFTANSEQQREGLANGQFDIAHSAIDNCFAMVDVARQDVVAFVGLDHGFNRLIVQPEIGSYDDLRGKILGVDAPDTAFALLAYDILRRKGVARRDYSVHAIGATRFRLEALTSRRIDFAMLNLPFALFALEAGLKSLDDYPLAAIGAYQSTAGFAKREWMQRNRSALVRYIAGYIEGLRWSLNPANRARAADLLCQRMQIPLAVAEQCCQIILDPAAGFAKDAKLNLQGVAKALELRTSFAGDGRERPPERYIDESFYRSALETL